MKFERNNNIKTIDNRFYLIAALVLLIWTIFGCTGYVPNHARARWGMEKMSEEDQLKDENTVAFDNIPYLVSWKNKYEGSYYDSLGGDRSTQATYDRLRFTMARKFAQLGGDQSEAALRLNDLMMKDIAKDSTSIELIYEKMFGSYAPAFDQKNLIDQALYSLADEIKNDRLIYSNPYVTNMLIRNDLLNLTLTHLERPEIKELDNDLIHVEFPGSYGEFIMEVDFATRGSKNIPNPKGWYMNSQGIIDKEFGQKLAGYNVSADYAEVFKQYYHWNQTVDVKRTDTLVAQILNVMVPAADAGSFRSADKVGVEVNYYFPLHKVGVQNDSLAIQLECLVTNLETSEEIIFGQKNLHEDVKGLPKEGVYNTKFILPDFHTIDTISRGGTISQYKISSRITTPIGERVENSFFDLPNGNSTIPIWDMQRMRPIEKHHKEQFYSLEKIILPGDYIIFELPVTGAYPYTNESGDISFSSALHLYWEPENVKKSGKGKVTIEDIHLVDWVPGDTLVTSPEYEHQYMKGESEIGYKVATGNSPNYVTQIALNIPTDLTLGKGVFRAIVMSYDYNKTRQEMNICDAVWRGVIQE